ncbi:hypothetical protein LSH36_597g00002 [Paralvinella palmiformis]|uniref:BRICHOS domain-containing protein n=1 Tax=Paralvinella palmiformis TaxID=53620 RepID=A0AAD9MWD6_9ANNE|nr:hypothetical protein LSH36_597g00002 [Paralvinella palmiformis]
MIFGNKQKPLSCSWLSWLLFYSGAVTAALIVLAVVGSLHVNKIDQYCNKGNTGSNSSTGQWKVKISSFDHHVTNSLWQDYLQSFPDYTTTLYGVEINSAESEEYDSVYLNTEGNKQMMKDSNGSITVFDFNKGVIGYYDQPSEKCYLTGGINPDLANPNEIDQYLSSQNETPKPSSVKQETVEYVTGEEVKDVSWLPTDIQGVCAGKQTSWLNNNSTLDVSTNNQVDSRMSSGGLCTTEAEQISLI